MHVHSPISHGNLTEKNIRPITVINWVVGIWWKNCLKRGKKNEDFCSKQISKCDNVSTCIFQGLFKKIVFRSVALSQKSYGLF